MFSPPIDARAPTAPLLIGGVGGSGTRVVAQIVESLGWFLGEHLNKAHDNLDFPGLHRFLDFGAGGLQPVLTEAELDDFQATMDARRSKRKSVRGWGWKNPPNYLFLRAFVTRFPRLSYLHVIRHGLDMAFSRNHNQVRQWGHLFGIEYGSPTAERSALRYWMAANDYAIATGRELLGDRFHLLSFEDLCDRPLEVLEVLVDFLGLGRGEVDFEALTLAVSPPASRGRFRQPGRIDSFSREELAAVERFGFVV